jgi:hypothetical protein
VSQTASCQGSRRAGHRISLLPGICTSLVLPSAGPGLPGSALVCSTSVQRLNIYLFLHFPHSDHRSDWNLTTLCVADFTACLLLCISQLFLCLPIWLLDSLHDLVLLFLTLHNIQTFSHSLSNRAFAFSSGTNFSWFEVEQKASLSVVLVPFVLTQHNSGICSITSVILSLQ